MVRQALRGIEWSFGRHLAERRGGAPHRCHCRAFCRKRSAERRGGRASKQRIYPRRTIEERRAKEKIRGRRKLADSPTLSQVHEGQSVRVKVRYSKRERESLLIVRESFMICRILFSRFQQVRAAARDKSGRRHRLVVDFDRFYQGLEPLVAASRAHLFCGTVP